MGDPRDDDWPLTRPAPVAPRWSHSGAVLIVVGELAAIGGVVWALAAKASVDSAITGATSMPTLPVHAYTQYTQRVVVPDYLGLQVGLLVGVLGVVLLLAGLMIAVAKRRTV